MPKRKLSAEGIYWTRLRSGCQPVKRRVGLKTTIGYLYSLSLSVDFYGSTIGIRTNGLNNVVCHSTWHHEIKINVYYNRPMGSHFKKIVVLIPFPNTYTCLCLSFPKYLVVENTESHTVDSTGTTGIRWVKME